MNWLERMNDWCGEMLDRAVRYDDLITFTMMSVMFVASIACLVIGILGGLGYLK